MRNSDRWVTPGVVITGLLVVGACVLATIAAVAWLTDRGLDPDPMLKLVGVAAGGLSGVLSLCLQLANRKTVAKVERNTGVLAGAVYDVADAMPKPVPRHAAEDTVAYMQATPGSRGS